MFEKENYHGVTLSWFEEHITSKNKLTLLSYHSWLVLQSLSVHMNSSFIRNFARHVLFRFDQQNGWQCLNTIPCLHLCAPQYPIRKGRVLGQLWYMPVSRTILIDLKLVRDKNVEKFCSHGKFGVVVDAYSKPLCLWITSLVMQVFSERLLRGPVPASTRTWFFSTPDTR